MLSRLPGVDHAIELLESEEGWLSEVVRVLGDAKQNARAAELCLRHHAYLDAASAFTRLGVGPQDLEHQLRAAECLLAHCRRALMGLHGFPVGLPEQVAKSNAEGPGAPLELAELAAKAGRALSEHGRFGRFLAQAAHARLVGDAPLSRQALRGLRDQTKAVYVLDEWLLLDEPFEVEKSSRELEICLFCCLSFIFTRPCPLG